MILRTWHIAVLIVLLVGLAVSVSFNLYQLFRPLDYLGALQENVTVWSYRSGLPLMAEDCRGDYLDTALYRHTDNAEDFRGKGRV